MKPRTRLEKEVVQLSHSLNVRQSDVDWIESKHLVGQTEYFAVYEAKGDWQVIRMFMYRSYTKKHEIFHEPLRYWIRKDGKFVIEAKYRHTMGNCYIDSWKANSELTICPNQSYYRDVRDLYANYTRIHSLIPELKRTGFRANGKIENGLKPFWFVRSLLISNRVETFFKLRQEWLTWKFYHYDTLTETLWQSIRVALRHGYHWDSQKEINDWCDMVNDLEHLGLDTRNPHYICPANLADAHQHWINVRHRKQEIEQWANEIKEAEAYEPYFLATREQFFGMVFTDNEISVQIIPSAKAIKEEGKAMHHCVGMYYNRPNSLILTAQIDGKRVETIEVDLKDYYLVQCQGVCNKDSEYHQRIVDLVNANLDTIRVLNANHKGIEKKKVRQLRKAA